MSAKWVAEAFSVLSQPKCCTVFRSRRADSTVAKWDSATLRRVRGDLLLHPDFTKKM